MEYIDKELLEAKWSSERQKYTTLETGMYAGEELIEFIKVKIRDNNMYLWLPKTFVPMPESIKKAKYPSASAPDFIMTSLDTSVNIGFSLLDIVLQDDEEVKELCQQFRMAITNVNPAIKIQNIIKDNTKQGNDMSWFDFRGYGIDGQSYNRICLTRMKKKVFHGIFNCDIKERNNWIKIVDSIFENVEEIV